MTDDSNSDTPQPADAESGSPTAGPSGSATDGPSGADDPSVVVIGAGPAGLTAAFELLKAGHTSTVLEADDIVGGISADGRARRLALRHRRPPLLHQGARVEALWHEILPDEEFLLRPRMSRIYYKGKYYDYPLKPLNALRNLGPVEAVRCVLSYLSVRVRPPKDQTTLEGYIVANYGWRLYDHFFKTYTEKVWGVPASADLRPTGAPSASRACRSSTPSGSRSAPSSLAVARARAGHQPHRGVPVPEVRTRDDVGGLHREGRRRRHQGPHGDPRRAHHPRGRHGHHRVRTRQGRRGARVPGRPRHLVDAVPAAASRPWTPRRPPRCRRRPTTCASATS